MAARTSPLLTALLVLATILTTSNLSAAPAVQYEPVAEAHELQVDGTSNIHDWSAKTQEITGQLQLPGQWRQSEAGLQLEPRLEPGDTPPQLEVRIPVRSLKSGKGGLDKKMYEAMDADDHSHVTFVLKRVGAVSAPSNPGSQAVTWEVTGDLTIAGTTRSVDLELNIEPVREGRLKIAVSKPLKMTDFNIDPPTAMMGMARAKDDVTVTATWVVERRTPQPTIPEADVPAAHRKQVTQVLIAYGRAQQALAANDHADAQPHLAMLVERVEALAQLDASELPEPLREAWPATLARLNATARNTAEAESVNATRTSFAVLSQTLGELLGKVGFEHSSPIAAYRYPNQRGTAGAAWIHVPLNDEQGKRFPVRSPYGAVDAQQPEQAALYLPSAVADDADKRTNEQ